MVFTRFIPQPSGSDPAGFDASGTQRGKMLAHAVKIPVIVVSAKEDYNNLLLQHFCWALYSSMGFPMIPDFC